MSITPTFKSLTHFELNPTQYLITSFLGIIGIGTILLLSPWATSGNDSLSFIDALFMATSAVCVTGLSVIDISTELSIFGQLVILSLVQIGGLGILTFTTIFAVFFGKKIGIKHRLLVKESFNQLTMAGLVKLVKLVISTSLVIQFIGGLLLSWQLFPHYDWFAIYLGFWHAISAFCNAGFDVFVNSNSLIHPTIGLDSLLVISILIIVGGLGFGVIQELISFKNWKSFTFHTRIVLSVTFFLLAIGSMLIFLLERNNHVTLANQPIFNQIVHSFFLAVSARTAGFASVDISSLHESTNLFVISQMFIGASPASVGGGIKTTTALVVLLTVYSYLKGKNTPTIFKRTISKSTSLKAFVVFTLAMSYIALTSLILSITENLPLFPLMFETTSAFATVGLSMGITESLSSQGKAILTLTMFIGRISLLSVMLAFLKTKNITNIFHPKAKVLIG